jgi:G:T-mismatch repair DNA endonuclease (very short patch repair protein)
MVSMQKSTDEKIKTVLEKNTFFTKALPSVEEEYQKLIDSVVCSLKKLRKIVEGVDIKEESYKQQLFEILTNFLHTEKYGLDTALAVCGLSYEKLYRIVNFLRIAYQRGLYQSQSNWIKETYTTEWKEGKIKSKLRADPTFAADLAKILLGEEPLINRILSPYERKTLDPSKFLFQEDSMLDTLARYSIRGRYIASKGGAPEDVIKNILDEMGVRYACGKVKGVGRKIDFIIPSETKPKVFIQCSYVETTSSGMGDKAKTEKDTVSKNIKENYPKATFILFVDGAGWIVRGEALRIMCEAGDYVFTFHEEQLKEFRELLSKLLSKEDYKQGLHRFFEKGKS